MISNMTPFAQHQTRPMDQRYLDLDSMYRAVESRRVRSAVGGVAIENLRMVPRDDGTLGVFDRGAKAAVNPVAAHGGNLTHWSMGQLAQLVGAPAAYLRKLPSVITAMNLQWQLDHRAQEERKSASMMVVRDANNEIADVQCFTSETYGRIWDADVIKAIRDRISPDWKVPLTSKASANTKRGTTLYASDRDCYVFLVNEANPIEVTLPGGKVDTLFRGFYCWNSEVGHTSFGFAAFLYRHICDNRMIMGMQEFKQLVIRHSAGGPSRFMVQAQQELDRQLNSSPDSLVRVVKAAAAKSIGDTEKDAREWLRDQGFTALLAQQAYTRAEEENEDPRTVWGIVQGLTATARDIEHTDERVDLERRAGKLLDKVAVQAA